MEDKIKQAEANMKAENIDHGQEKQQSGNDKEEANEKEQEK